MFSTLLFTNKDQVSALSRVIISVACRDVWIPGVNSYETPWLDDRHLPTHSCLSLVTNYRFGCPPPYRGLVHLWGHHPTPTPFPARRWCMYNFRKVRETLQKVNFSRHFRPKGIAWKFTKMVNFLSKLQIMSGLLFLTEKKIHWKRSTHIFSLYYNSGLSLKWRP